ncbi:MAG: hypothetical protein DRJ03_11995, partial [Chloroflexi bacterium]
RERRERRERSTRRVRDTGKGARAEKPSGNRNIVVLDRGWTFCGLLSKDANDTYTLADCTNIRKYKNGFGELTKGAKRADATLDDGEAICFKDPIFVVPVADNWRDV